MSSNRDRLAGWIVEEFRKDKGIDLSADDMAMQRVKSAAEKAELDLRSAKAATIELPFITADSSGPKHLKVTLTQAKFAQIVDQPGR